MTARIFELKKFGRCPHRKYIIDDSKQEVECANCGEKLNPVWVLKQFSIKENWMNKRFDELKAKIEKAKVKNKCKCQHCKKMTLIQK